MKTSYEVCFRNVTPLTITLTFNTLLTNSTRPSPLYFAYVLGWKIVTCSFQEEISKRTMNEDVSGSSETVTLI